MRVQRLHFLQECKRVLEKDKEEKMKNVEDLHHKRLELASKLQRLQSENLYLNLELHNLEKRSK